MLKDTIRAMRVTSRLHTSRLLLAIAIAALCAPLTALAQQTSPPPPPLDADGDFATLRGTETGPDVPVAAPPADPLASLATDTAKVLRVQRQAPIVGNDDDPPRPRSVTVEDDKSYDPLGIRLGSFILLPAVELRGGFTSNAAGASSGRGAAVGTIAPDVTLKSDWSEHEFTFNIHGSYDDYSDPSVAPKPAVNAEANARIDLPSDWTLRLKDSADYSTQSLSSIDYPTGVATPPGVETYLSNATLDGKLGHTILELRTTATQTDYEDGRAGSTIIPQGDRNNTLYSVAGRVGYEISPTIAPFVETELSRRTYEATFDSSGYRRASSGVTLRGGIVYSADPILSGELAIGWHREDYDDPAFRAQSVPTIDGSLIWSPTALTKFTLKTSTEVDPTTDPSSSGETVYSASLKAEHAVRRNVTVEADASWRHEYYEGIGETDITYQAGFGVTWKINRGAWVVGRFDQQYYDSSTPGESYPTTTATVGLRLQR